MPTIVPTITTSDPNVFATNLTKFSTFAKRIQIDASDGSFAPTNLVPLTALQPTQFPQGVTIDIHLMSARPSEHLPAILALKPSLCILHAEVDDNLAAVFAQLKQAGIKTGIAFIKTTFPGRVRELVASCDHAMVFAGTLGLWVLAWHRKLLNGQELLAHRQEWLRSVWVILPMLLLVFTLTMGREFIHIDEYSHWGVAAKDLYLYDKFYCIPEASTLFKDYIPGTTLFEYFFAVFGPYKSENVYRGLDVLLIACLTPAFKNTVKKGGSRTHIFVGWALFLILLYSNFSDVFTLLQVDAALAVMTANLLLTWFGDETKDSFTLAQLALSAMVREEMEGVAALRVPLVAEVSYGVTWAEAK